MRITVDKIASVARNLNLTKTLTLADEVEPKHGSVVVGRILNDKSTYNQLEDVNGRMSTLQSGDLIVGALGHRNALQGYEGTLPTSARIGETLQVLNLGGVIGECVSFNRDVGPPFNLEVLGQVLVFPDFNSRVGKPANIAMKALASSDHVASVPVVYIAGTCMNAGKTAAACALIRALSRAGLRVGGAKLTGVSLVRDILAMRDYGAEWSFDFTDTGVTTSWAESSQASARSIFAELAKRGAEVIVAETGDGIMGEYGVQAILGDKDLMARSAAFILCANDPVGVAGGLGFLESEFGIKADIVAGPATDNRVGTRFVELTFGVRAINARSRGEEFGEHVLQLVQCRRGSR
ncbi:MAG: hypothetical protein JST40_04400 [Armatimonadetes bacterium]|nr:hypothetical protein [Armatimonadota bacterium]